MKSLTYLNKEYQIYANANNLAKKRLNEFFLNRTTIVTIGAYYNIPISMVNISTLKEMGLYKTKGRGDNRRTLADDFIYDKVKKWLYGDNLQGAIRTVRQEFVFGKNIVENLFSDYEIIPQYKILNYFIDWYIPELNIAIEFDEKYHENKKGDNTRQKEIEKELNCKFIRYKNYGENR